MSKVTFFFLNPLFETTPILHSELGMTGIYDLRLVALSIVLATVASYTALTLAFQVTVSRKRLCRLVWLIGGAIAMGIGIWSMHFVGMLALCLPVSTTYDVPIVLMSVLDAVIASGVALFWVSRSKQLSFSQLLLGSSFMGLAIASMHYLGMAALRVQATLQYNRVLVVLSVAVAISVSFVALWLAFKFREQTPTLFNRSKLGSALIMGVAINGMHYTAMSAVRFAPTPQLEIDSSPSLDTNLLATTIGIATLIILSLTLLASVFEQRTALQVTQARTLLESERRLQTLIRKMPVGVLLLGSKSEVILYNQAFLTLLGLTESQLSSQTTLGLNWNAIQEDGTPFKSQDYPVQRAMTTRQLVQNVLMGLYNPTLQDWVWLLVNADPQLAADGSLEQVICTFSDITNTKRTEEKLRRITQAVESTSDAISIFDLSGKGLYQNQAFINLYGYTIDELNAAGGPGSMFVAPELADQIVATIRNGQSWSGELEIKTKSGKIVSVLRRVDCIVDDFGKPVALINVGTNITERKRMEEVLRSSEARYRSLVAATSQIVWTTDAQGQVIDMSQWRAFTGQSETQVQGDGWLDVLHPEDRSRTTQVWQDAITTKSLYETECRVQSSSGAYRDFAVRGVPVLDAQGKLREWVGTCTDITERKQAESALKASEEKFRTIVENVNDIIYLLQTDGVFSYVSPNWTELLGHDVEEVEGQSFAYFVHPDDLPACMEFLKLVLTTDSEQAGAEYRIKHKNEGWKWHTSSVSVFKDDSGNVLYYVGVCRDITLRKLAEEEVRNALEKERELSELKSRFINTTSHEFRTPLTTILSSAELLEDYGKDWAEERKIEHLQRIQSSVERMTQLLNDVLLLGKAEAGKIEYQPSPLNLDKLCIDLVEELQLGAGSRHIITFVKQGKCTTTCMDEKLLRQIFSNLLSNAIKYSPLGSTIQFEANYQEQEVIFQIKDSGIGIPIEDQQRLFEPFHRAKNVGTISGTGLGMAIVKKSVDLHGGQITVMSEVGVGTTFIVMMPLNYSSSKNPCKC
jgi:PAS domain S-box-containing protein